jgi:hypothetical protein
MIIENDIAFGALIEKLETTDDARNPGYKLIDNTLVIFTSDNGPNVGDNEGTNQESGGLRGKKAKIWEGGHRIPFIIFRKEHFEGGTINRNLFSLTDLFSTFAALVSEELKPTEAQDSLDSFAYWKNSQKRDKRPRYFFCHLGPPYENDAIAIRQDSQKVIVSGGLAQPWTKKGTRGSAQPLVSYDLKSDPYEKEDFSKSTTDSSSMVNRLLQIHNRGYSRELDLLQSQNLVIDDGWHNLRNDITGSIGFTFTLNKNQIITHMGMWDDHDRESPVREARGIPTEQESDQPSRLGKNSRTINSQHWVRLWEIKNSVRQEIAAIQITPEKQGLLEGEFRYVQLKKPVHISTGSNYILTMSTTAGDGDHFHDDASFDGLSPIINPSVTIVKSVMFRNMNMNQPLQIPSFADLHPDYAAHRFPVGPTLKFK